MYFRDMYDVHIGNNKIYKQQYAKVTFNMYTWPNDCYNIVIYTQIHNLVIIHAAISDNVLIFNDFFSK